MDIKQQTINIIEYGNKTFDLEFPGESYGRVTNLVKRVGYTNLALSLLMISKKTKFKDCNHFISYLQSIATKKALDETDITDEDYDLDGVVDDKFHD